MLHQAEKDGFLPCIRHKQVQAFVYLSHDNISS